MDDFTERKAISQSLVDALVGMLAAQGEMGDIPVGLSTVDVELAEDARYIRRHFTLTFTTFSMDGLTTTVKEARIPDDKILVLEPGRPARIVDRATP
jgi:hypothetical protein